jgi:hypothetical protein
MSAMKRSAPVDVVASCAVHRCSAPLRVVLAVIGAMPLATTASAQTALDRLVLDPRTYRSPSGAWAFSVDPSDRFGIGPGEHELKHSGETIWRATLPFSLWDAGVTDEGLVAGFAYEKGLHGGYGDEPDHGVLRVLLLDVSGTIRADHAYPRQDSPWQHGFALPYAEGLIVDDVGRRLIVRVCADKVDRQPWWVFSLDSGASLGRLDPGRTLGTPDDPAWIHESVLVPGTSLVLVRAYISSTREPERSRWLFALLDETGRAAWVHVVQPGPRSGDAETKEEPTIGGVDRLRFTLAEGDRRTCFRLEADTAGGWTAVEGEAEPIERDEESRTAPKPEWLPLLHLGTIELARDRSPRPAVRSLSDFVIAPEGELLFLRNDGRLVVVDQHGRLLFEREMPPSAAERSCVGIAALGGARVLAAWGTELWLLECAAGTSRKLADLPFEVKAVAALPGGPLLAAATSHLVALDGEGRKLWELRERDQLAGVYELCTTRDGRIGVFDGSGIQFIDPRGKVGRYLSREEILGSDEDLVEASHLRLGDLLRLDRARRAAALRARFPDGTPIRSSVQMAPDGALWTTDGHRLLKLDEGGVVDRELGEPLRSDRLANAELVGIGRDERIYLLSTESGALHSFDGQGKRLRVIHPRPSGPGQAPAEPLVNDSRLGLVVRQDPDGFRPFFGDQELESLEALWRVQPAMGRRWKCRRMARGFSLLAEDGAVAREVQRLPDGDWIRRANSLCMGGDGSLALGSFLDDRIALYDAEGTPLTTVRSPPAIGLHPNFAWNGRWLVATGNGRAVLFRRDGKELARFECPAGEPFIARNGRELWIWEVAHARIERFDLSGVSGR